MSLHFDPSLSNGPFSATGTQRPLYISYTLSVVLMYFCNLLACRFADVKLFAVMFHSVPNPLVSFSCITYAAIISSSFVVSVDNVIILQRQYIVNTM